MEEFRRTERARAVRAWTTGLFRAAIWLAISAVAVTVLRPLSGMPPYTLMWPVVAFFAVIALWDGMFAARASMRRTQYRDPRFAALGATVAERAFRVQQGMKEIPRAVRKEADRLRIDAEVIARDLQFTLRHADIAAYELTSLPAPYLAPTAETDDPRTRELHQIAETNLDRIARSREELIRRVQRAEARAAAFTATCDLWSMRVLHAKSSASANRLHEVGQATAEARRALAAIGSEPPDGIAPSSAHDPVTRTRPTLSGHTPADDRPTVPAITDLQMTDG